MPVSDIAVFDMGRVGKGMVGPYMDNFTKEELVVNAQLVYNL